MNAAQVFIIILKEFNHRKIWPWLIVLVLSSAGPLLATYIFSRGIAALEESTDLISTLWIFTAYFAILGLETLLRVGSKTKIFAVLEKIIVSVENKFVTKLKVRDKYRNKLIQATRNLTDSLSIFANYLIDEGITGLVSFISVPILLFFIDKRIFLLEVALMVIYLLITYIFGNKYEKRYEEYDASKELYFSRMQKSNELEYEDRKRTLDMDLLQNTKFKGWIALQNFIVLFKFLVLILLVTDIFNGLKNISDLVLVVGYTNQSQSFLNSVTIVVEKFMETLAGVDRLVIVSHKAPRGSITKIA